MSPFATCQHSEFISVSQMLVKRTKKAPRDFSKCFIFMSVGEKIRTPDLLVRSQTLYPAELRPHKMPQTGIEPVREYKSRRILSPVRLPGPPLRHLT